MTIDQEHRQRIIQYAPSDVLIALAKQRPGHLVKELYRDQETRVGEVCRVCAAETIEKLYEEYPGPSNFVSWFFRADPAITKSQINAALSKVVGNDLVRGIKPDIEETPKVYKVERSSSSVLFRCVASDRKQTVPIAFGQNESIDLLSYYDTILHFSDVETIVFGAYSAIRAMAVLNELDSFLGISAHWDLLKHQSGKSRDFYAALKKKLSALLVETKRHDPTGDYQTIALQARDKHPDLEDVPNFKEHYLAADSYYDVLKYQCKNGFDFKETVHVKFGHPFGRFTFYPNTSVSAIRFFQSKVGELLRPT